MSAASTPVAYPKSSPEYRSSGPRYTVFWPLLIFFLGVGALSLYQVISMQNRLDEMTQAIDKVSGTVKRAQFEKEKFFSIAKDILDLSPSNANAKEISDHFRLPELKAAQPALFQNLPTPTSPDAMTNSAPSSVSPPPTNASLLPAAPAPSSLLPEDSPGTEPAK